MLSRSKTTFFIKVLFCLLAACCGLAIYYSLTLLWLPSTSFKHETKIQRKAYVASDVVKIFMVTEDARLSGAVAAINSIVSNTDQPTHFYLVTDNTSSSHLLSWIEHSRLKDISYEINIFQKKWFTSQLQNLKSMHHRDSLLSYVKIFALKVNPDMEGRWIFLDDDIIVQGDISELANTTILSDHVGAFSFECDPASKQYISLGNKYGRYLKLQTHYLKELDINANSCVFSLGVYVLNMTTWKVLNVTEQLEFWINLNGRENIFNEPGPLPPLLTVLYNKTTPLDPSWHIRHLGVSSRPRYSHLFLKKAKLLHWDGHFKPWGRRTTYTDLWDRYYLPDPDGKFHLRRKVIKNSQQLR